MQKIRLFVVALAHFCVDSYATMLVPLLPLINERLDLSLAYAGLMGSIFSLASLSQPLMGLWGDRMRRRYLIIAGIILAALFTPLLGVAPNYAILIVVLALGGLGVHAFHPQVFSLAGELSGQRRSFGLSLFIFGGTLGLGLTPLWLVYYVGTLGLERLPLLALPGLLTVFLILKFVPLDNPHAQHQERRPLRQSLGPHAVPLLIITLVVILRSITSMGFGFFLTVLGKERGLSPEGYGLTLSIYNTSGVIGGLTAGYLADHMNSKPLVWGSILLAAPALYGFLHTEGPISYVLLAMGGCMILTSNSVLVATAQELDLQNAGLTSSLPLGFSWGVAGLTLFPMGYLADRIGVTETLNYLALLPLLAFLPALFLPARKRQEVHL